MTSIDDTCQSLALKLLQESRFKSLFRMYPPSVLSLFLWRPRHVCFYLQFKGASTKYAFHQPDPWIYLDFARRHRLFDLAAEIEAQSGIVCRARHANACSLADEECTEGAFAHKPDPPDDPVTSIRKDLDIGSDPRFHWIASLDATAFVSIFAQLPSRQQYLMLHYANPLHFLDILLDISQTSS